MTEPQLTATALNASADDAAGKPTLVLGPSLGTGAAALWGPIVPYLGDDFRLVAWDLPGHGAGVPSSAEFSMAELASAVVTLVRGLESEGRVDPALPAFYAGVSVGGATGLQLGLDYPGLFSGLAIICSAAKIGTPEGWTDRAELVAKAGTPTMVAGSAERWFAPGFIEKNPVVTTELLHTLQDADRFSYAHACRALADFDLRGELGRITDPVLAIAGAHDAVCPPADAEAVAAGVARGRSAVVPSAAHLAPAEDPATTARLLLEFFAGTDGA
ncbi:MAG: alpha/beta hydrolase [Arthrobacter sp.]|uniref:alpha/beta fold hydrolase n=1 Tax=Arthrobacter sp. TaxID=1667 RepID=UPI003499CBF2